MARAHRVDANQFEIVKALRRGGFWVDVTSGAGSGFPDLVVTRPDGRVFLVETKTDGGRMTPDQVSYLVRCAPPAYRIFTSSEEAIRGIMEAE